MPDDEIEPMKMTVPWIAFRGLPAPQAAGLAVLGDPRHQSPWPSRPAPRG